MDEKNYNYIKLTRMLTICTDPNGYFIYLQINNIRLFIAEDEKICAINEDEYPGILLIVSSLNQIPKEHNVVTLLLKFTKYHMKFINHCFISTNDIISYLSIMPYSSIKNIPSKLTNEFLTYDCTQKFQQWVLQIKKPPRIEGPELPVAIQ